MYNPCRKKCFRNLLHKLLFCDSNIRREIVPGPLSLYCIEIFEYTYTSTFIMISLQNCMKPYMEQRSFILVTHCKNKKNQKFFVHSLYRELPFKQKSGKAKTVINESKLNSPLLLCSKSSPFHDNFCAPIHDRMAD